MVWRCEIHKLSLILLLLFSAINIVSLVGNILVVSEPEELVELPEELVLLEYQSRGLVV